MQTPSYSDLLAYLNQQLPSEEHEAITSWIDATEENARTYEAVKKIWQEHHKKAEKYQPDLQAAWEKTQSKLAPQEGKTISWFQWAYKVAAVLIIAFSIGWYVSQYQSSETLGNSSITAIATIKHEEVNLPDGSTIYLRKGSALNYDAGFGKNDRQVSLKGEAFFDIAHDESKPFIIHTPETKTQVLGTSFTISEGEHETQVTVVSGKVSFKSKNQQQELILTKGFRGALTSDGQLIKTRNNDENFRSWQTGLLVFNNDKFQTVLDHLSRHYHVQFDILNKKTT